MKTILLSVLIFVVTQSASAGLLYNYSNLAVKDLDQMAKIVQDKIRESAKTGGDKIIPLKEALQAVYSRPNEDDMIEKLMSPLKNALEELDAWESTHKKLTTEALGALKNTKAFKPVVQMTYLIFLENMISEMKPRAGEDFEKKLLSTIRDAKVRVTKEATHERVLRMMKETRSPSEIADEALKEAASKPAPTPAPAVETVTPLNEAAGVVPLKKGEAEKKTEK